MPNVANASSFSVRFLFLLLLIVLCLLAKPPTLFADGTTYYVSTSGNNNQTGSSQQPFKTIQHAVNTARAGDTILVTPGVYREKVVFNYSGSVSDGPITLKASSATRPIIDGSNFPTNQSHNVFYIADQSHIVVDGFEIRNFQVTGAERTIVAIRVTGTSSNIELSNNYIHHIEADAATLADALGIAVYGRSATTPMRNITITGNELSDMKLGWSESVVVSGNVDGFLISNNHIHHNNNIGIDVVGFEDWLFNDQPVADNQARNGVIADNLVHHIDATGNPAYVGDPSAGGIYVDGGANVTIERNKVYENNFGISVGSENAGHDSSGVIVRNNLVYNNHIAGIITGGYNTSVGGASNNQFIHNTLYHNGTTKDNSGEFWIQNAVRNTIVQNNIFYADADNVFVSNWFAAPTNTTVDNNLYYSTLGQNGTHWAWNGAYVQDFTAWRSASNNDTSTIFVNPNFASLANKDFSLTAGSPAIDAAVTLVSAGTTDYAGAERISGSQPDIGAYEFSQNTPPRGRIASAVAQDCVLHGWAFDPDFPADSINVRIEIDGNNSFTIPTDKVRQDVNDAFGLTGLHGIRWQIPAQYYDDATHTLTGTALDMTGGATVPMSTSPLSFSCSSDRPPRGHVDFPINQYCEVSGWAFDSDVPSESIDVELTIDNSYSTTLTTDFFRRGVNDKFGTSGNHGFRLRIPVQFHDNADHTLTAVALNSQDGSSVTMVNSGSTFRCAEDLPPRAVVSTNVTQHCEVVAWAFDYDIPDSAIEVRFEIDNSYSETVTTDRLRQDVNNAFDLTGRHGVLWQIPQQFQDDSTHVVRAYAINSPDGSAVAMRNSGFEFSCASNALPRGYIAHTMPSSCILFGWAFDPDVPASAIDVRVVIDGVTIETITTDVLRQDVNNAFGITGVHGFRWTVPTQFRDGQAHTIRAYAVNEPTGPDFQLVHSGQSFSCTD